MLLICIVDWMDGSSYLLLSCSKWEVAGDAVAQDDTQQEQHQHQQLSWFGFHIDELSGKVTLSQVDEAIAYIAKLVREQGPFDGVFGFSQGGTIASLVFQHQRTLCFSLFFSQPSIWCDKSL